MDSGPFFATSRKSEIDIRGLALVAALAAASGHVLHNLTEFPPAILWSWETLVPVAVTAVLAVAAILRPSRRWLVALGAWGLVTLVLGALSVLPLPFLPFDPEQSAGHYLTHVVYAGSQLPVLLLGWWALRHPRTSPR
ncbi:MAG: hypothetical protein ACRDUY_09235 [Nitriliruptorales bacterium]